MVKRTFIVIIVFGIILFCLPVSFKFAVTKYPRLVLLAPLTGINNFVTSVRIQKKALRNLSELTTQLLLENAQLAERLRKNQFSLSINMPDLVQATIIARDNESGLRFLTIDKGTRNNIKVNMPVLSPFGIVGKIIETNETQSIIETPLSAGLKISAISQRSRVVGVIEYANFTNLRFKYAFAESDIQPGDTIVTSGLGGIFPKGINIGTVLNVTPDPTHFFQYVDVKPTVNYNTLEEVFVLTSEHVSYPEPTKQDLRQRLLENLKIQIPQQPRIK